MSRQVLSTCQHHSVIIPVDLVHCVNQSDRGDPHHPRVVSEADHSAPDLAEQHASIRIRLLGGCGSDGLGQSLCVGLVAVCEEVHFTEPVPTEPPPAGKHSACSYPQNTKRDKTKKQRRRDNSDEQDEMTTKATKSSPLRRIKTELRVIMTQKTG